MISNNERITLRQMQLLLILSAMGTGVIILPRRAAEFAAQDGWLVVLGLSLLGMALAALAAAAGRVKPGASFTQYTRYALGRPVALICAALLWVKLVLSAGLELRIFLTITQQVLLPETPMWMVGGLMLFVCAYAAVKGIEARARIAEVLVPLLALWLIFLFTVALMDIDLSNLQPAFSTPPRRLGMGVLRLGFIFTGLECLLLSAPYINKGKKMPRAAATAAGVAGLIITAVVGLTLAKFGSETVNEPWPLLRMMDMLRLPGSFIERQEALMFAFWIITVFAMVNALIFFGGVLLGEFFGKKAQAQHESKLPRRAVHTALTALAVFAVICIPWEAAATENRLDWLFYTGGVFFLVIFPLAVLAGAAVRKKFEKRKNRAAAVQASTLRVFALLVLFCAPLFALAGCYDRIEIEDRLFVTAIHLDKDEENYQMNVLLMQEEEEDEPPLTKTAAAPTLTAAMQQLGEAAGAKLYFGHAKILTLGFDILEDARMTENIFTTLIANPQFDRQIQLLAVCSDEPPPLEELLEKADHHRVFSPDLATVWKELNEGGATLIATHPEGAIAVKDFAKKFFCEAPALRGFLWCFPQANEKNTVTALHIDTPVPFVPDKHNAQVRFAPHGNGLKAFIKVTAHGSTPELPGDISPDRARELIEAAIAEEISQAAALFQENNLDAYQWLSHLHKKQPGLHKRVAHRWDEVFREMLIIPEVRVKVQTQF